MYEMVINLDGAFAWKFYNLPDTINGFALTEEYKTQKTSDINIGIDKANRSEFLRMLEHLVRQEDIKVFLNIPLKETPEKSPHYLDDEDSYMKYPKASFNRLIIRRINEGKNIKVHENELILEFDKHGIFEFFTRMYINFEIYATFESNIIMVIDSVTGKEVRLVIWGVFNGKPIEY